MSQAFRDRVADYFRGNPGAWIDGLVLQEIGGRYASRTRISECRTQLGMVIDNRVRHVRGHTVGCPALQAWDIEGACQCDEPITHVVSEYRFVPKSEPVQASLLDAGQGAAA